MDLHSFSSFKLAYLMIGILLGFLFAQIFHKEKVITIGYVSQIEVMEYEKKRVDKINNADSKQLFFGKLELAADLVAEEAKAYEDKDFKVIFSNDKVYGENVVSLSEEVHKEVIERLQEDDK